jgi:hypothetical protein
MKGQRLVLSDTRAPKTSNIFGLFVKMVWAITLGEALLLGVCAVVLSKYWMMLPVWMRTLAVLGLIGVAAVGIFRIVRHFRNSNPGDRN